MDLGADLMAKMTVKGLDKYNKMLDQLGKEAPKVAKKAVYRGADIVANEVRRGLEKNLSDPHYAGTGEGDYKTTKPTGDLLAALGVAPIDTDAKGNTNTKIGFDGYDHKGVPNALKARAMESGTSTLRKRPFVRPAVNATKRSAQDAMGKVVEEEIAKIYAL
jgi:HK97 gp10 family phage protein